MARTKNDDATKTAKPKKTRWYKQVWDVYQMTRRNDPKVTWLVIGAFLLVVAVCVGLGSLWNGNWITGLIIGIPFGVLAAMFLLTRRAEAAAYRQIDGQPGAARAALGSVRRGNWTFDDEPVAIEPRSQSMVFRGAGRAGVLLVGEGAASRRLLEQEKKRTARVLPGVPITTLTVGDGPDDVRLTKLVPTVQRYKPTLTKAEAAEVNKRLRALGTTRLPIPKGIDPMRARPDRKGMRGR